ncbi:hypothetical protein FRC19_002597 [Serendipita sp. 401]|nr:hypothetical protein FRC19_002597 [Serendipita sp. 401]KAG8839433.1 hypothetical protein FRC18_010913 [Serendipita sp. 400]
MPRRADVMLSSEHAETQQGGVLEGIDHYQLPQSTVTKIAKAALPSNAKLQKESVLALVKGSTVFINYIAAAAQEVANAKGHKTIVASDVLQALELTEFGDMLPALNKDLAEYRARLKKAPPATSKKEPAASTKDPKGKGRVSSGKSGSTGEEATIKTSNGKQEVAADEAIDEEDEEPYSEPDVPDDELDAEDEQEQGDEEEDMGTGAGDQMDVDEDAGPVKRLDEKDRDSE